MSARDPSEAERLTLSALALQEELLDADEEIRAVDALHREEAYRRGRDLARFHGDMIRLWEYLRDAQRRGDVELVRYAAEAIERETRAEFERRSTMS